MTTKNFQIGDRVREAGGDYTKMPSCVKELLTYTVVMIDGDDVGIAYHTVQGIWRPQMFKKDQLILV